METLHKEKIKSLLPDKIRNAGSQNKAATMIGCSAATLTQVQKGNWENISDEMWNTIGAWAGYRPGEMEWKTCGTENFLLILNRCKEAQQRGTLQSIDGATGYGKTTALEYFANKNTKAHYIRCRQSWNSKEFLKSLCQSIGIEVYGSKFILEEAIISEMNSRRGSVMLLDDAGKLNDTCFGYLMSIQDGIKGISGIVMAGIPEELKKRIVKMSEKGKVGFSQLKRRVRDWQPLTAPDVANVTMILKELDIISKEPSKEEKMIAVFVQNSTKNYGDIYNLVTGAALVNNGKVTLQSLELVTQRNEKN